MTLALQPSTSGAQGEREFHFTREAYRALADVPLFERAHVELIRGRLIEMPPFGTHHGSAVMRGSRVLRRVFAENAFTVRPGLSFVAADDSEPEPDLCVVRGEAESIVEHPDSCLLLVEISSTTLNFDRRIKAPLYAESGVVDYWIVNLVDRVLEVHRGPVRHEDGTWGYESITSHQPDDAVRPLAAPEASITVRELLP